MDVYKAMIDEARANHGSISPCNNKTFSACFQNFNGKLVFWYNSDDGNTHIVKREVTHV